LPSRIIPTWRHITSRILSNAAGDGLALTAAFAAEFAAPAEFPGLGAGLPGKPTAWRLLTGASFIMARPLRAPNTKPSRRELLAKRLAPCTPVSAVSPAA